MLSGYEYSYKPQDEYCYPGTDILRNNFGIQDFSQLMEVEREITFLKSVKLHNLPVSGQFDFQHLKRIHHYIFSDIYDWAGDCRKGDFFAKGNAVFCRGPLIPASADQIFAELKKENYLRNMTSPK